MGSDMKGLAEGIVNTSAEMRAPGFRNALERPQGSLGSCEQHQTEPGDRRIEDAHGRREILRCAFEGFDVGETSALGRCPNVGQHGCRYVAGHHLPRRADSLRCLQSLAAAPQARSRTRMPASIPAMSNIVSVTSARPAANTPSHLAQPGAADSHVLSASEWSPTTPPPRLSIPRIEISRSSGLRNHCLPVRNESWPAHANGGMAADGCLHERNGGRFGGARRV